MKKLKLGFLTVCASLLPGLSQSAEILVPAAADLATISLNNPVDVADNTDVYPLLWTHNPAAATATGGVMTGTPRDIEPHFQAHFPQIARTTTTLDNPFIEIDAARFTKVSFYMWLPETLTVGSTSGRIMWHPGGESVAQFDASYSQAPILPVYHGWHHYTVDLKAIAQTNLLAGQRWAGPFVRTSEATAVSTTDSESLFAWVEALAPGLLRPNGEAPSEIAGFYARCYAQFGQCIAVKDNRTCYFDGKTLTEFGSSSPLIAQAKAAGF